MQLYMSMFVYLFMKHLKFSLTEMQYLFTKKEKVSSVFIVGLTGI